MERNKTPSESSAFGWLSKLQLGNERILIRVLVLFTFSDYNKKIKTMHSGIERL